MWANPAVDLVRFGAQRMTAISRGCVETHSMDARAAQLDASASQRNRALAESLEWMRIKHLYGPEDYLVCRATITVN
jgi:hypothetical protein